MTGVSLEFCKNDCGNLPCPLLPPASSSLPPSLHPTPSPQSLPFSVHGCNNPCFMGEALPNILSLPYCLFEGLISKYAVRGLAGNCSKI